MAGFKVDTSGSQQASTTKKKASIVDWKGMEEEIVGIVGTQKKAKTVVGFPSGYIDLGLQPRPDFEQKRDANDTKQNAALAAGTASVIVKDLYDNGTKYENIEVYCNPRTPAKAFTLVVDFPQYQVDKGKYFGEDQSNPAAYRVYMGGTWSQVNPEDTSKKMQIIPKHMYLVENTINPQNKWALGTGTTIAKMGVAADLDDDFGLVSKDDITGILGKPMLFSLRTFIKPDKKDASKSYFTELIKFCGEVAEGTTIPEFDESTIHGVNFHQANDPDMLNLVNVKAINTMKLAEDWDKSVIKKELEEAKASWKANKDAEQEGAKAESTPTPTPKAKTEAKVEEVEEDTPEEEIDFDDDVAF